MARLAAEAELAAMDVSMTVGTGAAHVGELQRQVARSAGDPLVTAVEGSAHVTVLEVRLLAERFPGLLGMTLHAIEIELTVRTASVVLGPGGHRNQE
jgi:hypothetical protein